VEWNEIKPEARADRLNAVMKLYGDGTHFTAFRPDLFANKPIVARPAAAKPANARVAAVAQPVSAQAVQAVGKSHASIFLLKIFLYHFMFPYTIALTIVQSLQIPLVTNPSAT
jgi:hypothetical protein